MVKGSLTTVVAAAAAAAAAALACPADAEREVMIALLRLVGSKKSTFTAAGTDKSPFPTTAGEPHVAVAVADGTAAVIC
jgi:hypothetical protein